MRAILRLALAASLLAAPHTAAAQIVRTVNGDRCSGAIVTGGASQVAANAGSSRGWLVVQNPKVTSSTNTGFTGAQCVQSVAAISILGASVEVAASTGTQVFILSLPSTQANR